MPENRDFYSDEADDILGRPPSWIIRWGITVVFVIFGGILLGCYFIKYPETVAAPIVLTTVNPPADLTARYDGLIDTVCVVDGERVNRGDLIALIANPADYGYVRLVEDSLAAASGKSFTEAVFGRWFEKEYRVGDIQNAYSEFRKLSLDYRHYLQTGYIDRKTELISSQIAKSEEHYAMLLRQGRMLEEDLLFERRNFKRDSLLFAGQVISQSDYDNAYRSLLDKLNGKASFDAALSQTELSIIQLRQQLVELGLQQDNEKADYERQLSQARQQLLLQIGQWKLQYAVFAPADGTVTLLNYWSKNQKVAIGDRIATVIPDGQPTLIGHMHIPSAGFGKVEEGQTVNVKLNGYPYMEFGVLKGVISSISAVPDGEKGYVAQVTFPAGLKTTYDRDLQLIQQMDGEGEIITDDQRLIQRFLQPVRALFDK